MLPALCSVQFGFELCSLLLCLEEVHFAVHHLCSTRVSESAGQNSVLAVPEYLIFLEAAGPTFTGRGEPVANFGRHREILSTLPECVNQNYTNLFTCLRTSSGIGKETPSRAACLTMSCQSPPTALAARSVIFKLFPISTKPEAPPCCTKPTIALCSVASVVSSLVVHLMKVPKCFRSVAPCGMTLV